MIESKLLVTTEFLKCLEVPVRITESIRDKEDISFVELVLDRQWVDRRDVDVSRLTGIGVSSVIHVAFLL